MEQQDNSNAMMVISQELATISLEERCRRLPELYSPVAVRKRYVAVTNPAQCVQLSRSGEPCLLKMSKQGETAKVQLNATICLHLVVLDRFLHLKNPLSEEEVEFIASQIVSEYGGALTFADLKVFFDRIKSGKYGKMYERLSAPDILTWLGQYFDERLDAAEQISINEARATYGSPAPRTKPTRTQSDVEKDNEFFRFREALKQNGYKPIE